MLESSGYSLETHRLIGLDPTKRGGTGAYPKAASQPAQPPELRGICDCRIRLGSAVSNIRGQFELWTHRTRWREVH